MYSEVSRNTFHVSYRDGFLLLMMTGLVGKFSGLFGSLSSNITKGVMYMKEHKYVGVIVVGVVQLIHHLAKNAIPSSRLNLLMRP